MGAYLGACSELVVIIVNKLNKIEVAFESSPGTIGRSDFIMRQRPGRLGRIAEKLLTYEPLMIECLRSSR